MDHDSFSRQCYEETYKTDKLRTTESGIAESVGIAGIVVIHLDRLSKTFNNRFQPFDFAAFWLQCSTLNYGSLPLWTSS